MKKQLNPVVQRPDGADGIRTHDPHIANVMLFQLSYSPIIPRVAWEV